MLSISKNDHERDWLFLFKDLFHSLALLQPGWWFANDFVFRKSKVRRTLTSSSLSRSKKGMWSSWSESAKSSITSALEKTGDAITKAATNARHPTSSSSGATPEAGDSTEPSPSPSPSNNIVSPTSTGRYAAERPSSSDEDGGDDTPSPSRLLLPQSGDALLKNLQVGWTSVVETTKASLKVAQEKIEEEQHKLTERMHKARSNFIKRDIELPLDVPALKDAQVVYLTDRLITLSHPALASTVHPDIITAERKLAAVAHLLQKRHQGRYMVWNLSEVEYDTTLFDDQVLTFCFPGSPSPPLGLLLKLLISMESWLKADNRNVAVIHCLTGKGRTSTVLAAFLCWMGEADFADIYDALAYIAACKQVAPDDLTIPSQRRYASYFKNMLDSVRPSQPPLLLKRVIMSEAPRFAKGPALVAGTPGNDDDTRSIGSHSSRGLDRSGRSTPTASTTSGMQVKDDDALRMGCAPYLQLFKAGQLLHTAPASLSHAHPSTDQIPFCRSVDGSVSFHIDQLVQGDVLLRCRHVSAHNRKQRVSMFRVAFHTGYVPPKVMRLTKSQLDGACQDARFPEDFFVDLIFEAVDAETASQYLRDSAAADAEADAQQGGSGAGGDAASSPAVKSGGSDSAKALAGGSTTVRASTYDTMLHRDSRFWDVIATRREQHASAAAAASGVAGSDSPAAASHDRFWGPTVGQRRDLSKRAAPSGSVVSTPGGAQGSPSHGLSSSSHHTALETFRIGGELDFLPETVEPEAVEERRHDAPSPTKPPKKDSLMEALMGALTDDGSDNFDDSEEIVFDDAYSAQESLPPAPAVVATPTIVQLPPLPSKATTATTTAAAAPTVGATSDSPSAATSGGALEVDAVAPVPVTTEEQVVPASGGKPVLDVTNDTDVDALLAASGVATDALDLDLDLDLDLMTDDDLLAVDDADLDDMESFLAGTTK